MREIERKVRQAQRRLVMGRFVRLLPWCLLAAFVPALCAVVASKVWPVTSDGTRWAWQWLGGAAGAGVTVAAVATYLQRARLLEAAMEVDRRFELKERLSSTLVLEGPLRTSEVGQALVHDAERLAGRVDVADRFPIRPSWHGLLPMITAAVAVLVAFGIHDARRHEAEASSLNRKRIAKEIEKSVEDLRKKLEQRKKDADKKGLHDANRLFELLQKELRQVKQEGEADYKKALVKINDLAKELEKRKEKLGGIRAVKKQFEQLGDVEEGPADKIAKALKAGDMQRARRAMDALRRKLEEGKLTKKEKKQLAKQLKQLSQELRKMKKQYEDAKKALREEIERKKQQGDFAAVNQLQKKLDQLEKQKKQMGRLGEMANQAERAQQALNRGDSKEASDAMNQLSQSLSEMQQESQELESLAEAMDELEDTKEAIAQACEGQGSPGGIQDRADGRPTDGMGAGTGLGDRPEEKGGTAFYRSRVRGKVGKGEAVRSGELGGPNRAGQSVVEAQRAIESAVKEDPTPIVNERLPRPEQRHATEYFRRIRQGK